MYCPEQNYCNYKLTANMNSITIQLCLTVKRECIKKSLNDHDIYYYVLGIQNAG